MSSANLVSLLNAINTNTLSASEQSALGQALSAVIPTFPTPGDNGAITTDDEAALARAWMSALYSIAFGVGSGGSPVTLVNEILPAAAPNPVTVTPNPGIGNVTLGFNSPSRETAVNTSPITLTNAATDEVSAALVPSLTGKLRVIINGVVANSDTSAHTFVVQLNGNAGASDFAIQQLPTLLVPASTTGFPFTLAVDCDQANVPHTFTVGALATLIANLTGVTGGFLTIPAQGCRIIVQELFS